MYGKGMIFHIYIYIYLNKNTMSQIVCAATCHKGMGGLDLDNFLRGGLLDLHTKIVHIAPDYIMNGPSTCLC